MDYYDEGLEELEEVHRVDPDQLLEQLETAANKKSFSDIWVFARSADKKYYVIQGGGIKAIYLKALPSVIVWIFLSSATMSSISCSSCMAPG